MTKTISTLKEMMQQELPDTGILLDYSGYFLECMDLENRRAWMGIKPASAEDFAAWTIPPNHYSVGFASASMDMSLFRHDPDGPGVPVQFREIDGHRCLNVGIPLETIPPEQEGMPMKITIAKGHTVGFDAGRTVKLLRVDGKYFVELIGDGSHDPELVLPEGGAYAEVTLETPWVVELPNPTVTYFWFMPPDARSFQGPVALPSGVELE